MQTTFLETKFLETTFLETKFLETTFLENKRSAFCEAKMFPVKTNAKQAKRSPLGDVSFKTSEALGVSRCFFKGHL